MIMEREKEDTRSDKKQNEEITSIPKIKNKKVLYLWA